MKTLIRAAFSHFRLSGPSTLKNLEILLLDILVYSKEVKAGTDANMCTPSVHSSQKGETTHVSTSG